MTTATPDINNPASIDPGAEYYPEGDLPEQMGGARTTLLPDTRTFLIPTNIAQLWHDVEIEDGRPYTPAGQPNPTKGQKIKRKQLKFDRNSPLVVVGGKDDGQPMTATFTNNPRARGKKDDAKTPWISDLAYVLDIGLQGNVDPKQRVRPTSPEALVAEINKYAGKTIRLETGLSGQCRPDKVRYIPVQIANEAFNPALPASETNQPVVEQVVPDPSGQKGCGKRFYTDSFKDPATGKFDTELQCDNPACGNILRGYESVERILAPLGTAALKSAGAV